MAGDMSIGAEILASIPGMVNSDTASSTARNRCDVSSELCCPVEDLIL